MVKLKFNKDVAFFLMMLVIASFFVLAYTIVLAKAGLDEPEVASTLNFFMLLGIVFYITTIIVYLFGRFYKQDNRFGDNITINSPEEGVLKKMSRLQQSWLALIVFGTLFLIATLFNAKSLTGLRVLPQQFTPTDSLIFTTLLTPTAENLLFATTLGILLNGLRILAIKYNMSTTDYKTYAVLTCIVGGGLFGVLWHQTAYQGSDLAILVVAGFWALMGLIGYYTFFMIPLIFHMMNNFFIDFSRLFTSTTVTGVTITVLVILAFGYYQVYKGKLLGGLND